MPSSNMTEGPDGWSFAPEGAAIHTSERTAVIADVHLGYEWARAAGGDCVPEHSLAETLARLSRLLGRAAIERLVVAGDLVESPRPCRRTDDDVARLSRWLAGRGVELVALAGNHDPRRGTGERATCEVGGWVIGHGHRPIVGPLTISGHLHPAIRYGRVSAPCFVVGPRTIVLPAFSPNAAGWSVATEPIPEHWRDEPIRCLASTGEEILDFGPLAALRRKLKDH